MTKARTIMRRSALAVLGLAGCGEETRRSGVDVGDSRVGRVVASICAQELRCREVDEREQDERPREQDCTREARGYFEELRAQDALCADARLDFEECAAKLSCEDSEQSEAECAVLYAAIERRCEYELDGWQEQ